MTKSRNILPPRRYWTEVEIQMLRECYADSRTEDLAQVLGREVRSVYQKADSLGLKKSAAFLASDLSGRVQRGKQDPRMKATQFKPGMKPWNEGTHYTAGGRSTETRFAKGRPAHEAHNYLPIGSLRINKDGCLERKVTDDPSLSPARRWVGVHRLVWIEAHGPIPEGQAVVFKPGRRTTELDAITPDALELLSRRELMARNTVHNLPQPLAQLVQLRGALNRQINRKAREAETT